MTDVPAPLIAIYGVDQASIFHAMALMVIFFMNFGLSVIGLFVMYYSVSSGVMITITQEEKK